MLIFRRDAADEVVNAGYAIGRGELAAELVVGGSYFVGDDSIIFETDVEVLGDAAGGGDVIRVRDVTGIDVVIEGVVLFGGRRFWVWLLLLF